MDPRPPTPAEEDRGGQNAVLKAVQIASTRQLRSRRPDCSAVSGKVRVSKPTLKSRNIRNQTFKAPKSKPIIVDSDVMTQSSIQQVLKHRETKPQRAKETPLGQLRPQTVSKAERIANAGMKSRPRTKRCDAGQTPEYGSPSTGILLPLLVGTNRNALELRHVPANPLPATTIMGCWN